MELSLLGTAGGGMAVVDTGFKTPLGTPAAHIRVSV